MNRVFVLGASGKTGRALVGQLRGRGELVREATRDPATAEAVRFDWADPSTHGPALAAVDRVYLIAPPSAIDPMPMVGPFLTEARRRGVKRVVLLGSAIEFPGAPGRLELEDRVRSEPGWLVLRPSGFMQNFLAPHPLGTAIRDQAELPTSAGAARVGWIDTRDIAASAAAVLTRPLLDDPLGDDFVLTGPRALSYREVADLIAAAAGHPVRIIDLDVHQLTDRLRAAGLPPGFAASLAATETEVRTGRYNQVTDTVQELTGKPPRSFEAFCVEHAAAGHWPAPRST